MKICIRFLFAIISLLSVQLHAQIEGTWYSNLSTQGIHIPLVFHFEATENNQWTGKLDSPEQKSFGIPIDKVSFKNDSLQLQIKALGISYKGKLIKRQIQGVFKQGALAAKLDLDRTKKQVEEKKLNRPQEPQPPFPYHEEEVQFLNKKDSIWLAGTLTYPKNKTNFPIVVMISGSGAQDRNSEILGHKPFLVAADYFTRNGMGVLRFDDRGTAASEGDFSSATSKDFMEDVYAAVEFLKNDERFTSNTIGLYGHSEGGMIAPLLADSYKNSVDFLVLLAPPTEPISELMLKQQELVSLSSGIGSDEIALNAQINKSAYQIINQYEIDQIEPLTENLNTYFESVTAEYPEIGGSMGLTNEQYIKTMVSAYTNPWMVYFLKYKPENYLKNLELPILAIFAEKDMQVSAPENADKMKSIILKKNKKNEVITFSKKNHLFQTSETGDVSEYAEIEETISEEVLQKVKNWVLSLN